LVDPIVFADGVPDRFADGVVDGVDVGVTDGAALGSAERDSADYEVGVKYAAADRQVDAAKDGVVAGVTSGNRSKTTIVLADSVPDRLRWCSRWSRCGCVTSCLQISFEV
jgi:hypothetical protein